MKYIKNKIPNQIPLFGMQFFFVQKPKFDYNQVINFFKKNRMKFISEVDNVYFVNLPEFKKRNITAMFENDSIYVSAEHEDYKNVLSDILHELGHAFEEKYKDLVYKDKILAFEFLSKRKNLKHSLAQRFDYVEDYNFSAIEFDPEFDDLLTNQLGYEIVSSHSIGVFLRPYSVTSLREYFATGFEQYFLEDRTKVKNICPILNSKIEMIEELINEY